MKSFLLLALSALSVAQSTVTSTGTVTTTHTLSPQETCIAGCAPSDVNCQASCVGVPHPGDTQMNLTTQCVANCDQGDGSAAATNAYTACRNACISSYIILSGTAAPGGPYTTAGQAGNATATTTGGSTAKSGGKLLEYNLLSFVLTCLFSFYVWKCFLRYLPRFCCSYCWFKFRCCCWKYWTWFRSFGCTSLNHCTRAFIVESKPYITGISVCYNLQIHLWLS
jgi:hypothetical protein